MTDNIWSDAAAFTPFDNFALTPLAGVIPSCTKSNFDARTSLDVHIFIVWVSQGRIE